MLRFASLVALALQLLVTAAWAADNAVIITPGSGVTMRSKDIGGGVQSMVEIPGDTAGTPLATAPGTPNGSFALPIQGVTGGTAIPVSAASGSVASGAYASGAFAAGALASGSGVDGWDLTQGAQADAACSTDNGTCSIVKLLKRTNQNLTTLNTTAGASLPAGTALIGGVEMYDAGGSTKATVKAASTPSVAGDTSLITQINPEQPQLTTPLNVAVANTTNGGAALVKGGVGVVSGGSFYQAVAASQTATVLQSSTGTTGDYLSHCTIYPTSTTPGVVTVFDNSNTAANSAILFPGGASSVSNLVPFTVPVGAISKNGAWEVTTGANVSVVCYGKFS